MKNNEMLVFNIKADNILLFLIVFVALINLLFINKAFHIDDTLPLLTAKQIIKDPLRPYSFMLNWGVNPKGITDNGWRAVNNPPLIPYYYAAIISIFGDSEPALHLSYLVFTLLALISMYFLAKRFLKEGFAATLLLALSPAFFVSSHSLMLDIPFLAFSLCSVVLFVYGTDLDNIPLLICAGILVSCAILTKYFGLLLIPLLFLYALLSKRRHCSYYLLIPLGAFFLWSVHGIIIYGKSHILSLFIKANEFTLTQSYRNVIATFSFLSGATIFPIFSLFLISFFEKWMIKSSIIFAFLFSIFVFTNKYFFNNYGIIHKIFFLILAVASLLIIMVIIRQCIGSLKERNKDGLFLVVWFFVFIILINTHCIAARQIVLVVPPMILLALLFLKKNYKFSLKIIFIICILLMALISSALAYADYKFADIYRNFAFYIIRDKKFENKKVYFLGHWGFQYYMMEKGYIFLSPEIKNLEEGDLLIKPSLCNYENNLPTKLNEILELIEERRYPGKIKLLSSKANAGFYSQGWGFLPFSFSDDEVESFRVLKITRNFSR